MERVPIKQMNDYAISKWAGEMQCLNHAAMFGVDVVRVRPVGCYGPHEYYSPYRGVIPIFVYKALHGWPFHVSSWSHAYLRLRGRIPPRPSPTSSTISSLVRSTTWAGARNGRSASKSWPKSCLM